MAKSPNSAFKLSLARQLVARLERLSADSYYAHQASGIRGALLRELARADSLQKIEGEALYPSERFDTLIELGFEILHKSALEL